VAKRARPDLLIERLPIGALRLDPRNPRQHSDRQIKQIARSIESFDFIVPILIDRNANILAGHGRVRAGLKLGLDEVPVIRIEHLSEAQAKAFRIADNRLTDNSEWDDRLLAETLKELSNLELDFNIEAIGFEMGEIDLRIEGLDSDANDPDETDVSCEWLSKSAQRWRGDAGDVSRLRGLMAARM